MPDPVSGDWEDDKRAKGGDYEVARQVSPLRHGARDNRGGQGRKQGVHNPAGVYAL